MRLKDIMDKYNWEIIGSQLAALYPDQKGNLALYRQAWLEMKGLAPAFSDEMRIVTKRRANGQVRNGEHDVFGVKSHLEPTDLASQNLLPADQPTRWSLSLTSWEEWLGMEITPETLEYYTEIDIACHCLFEMTVYSWANQGRTDFAADLIGRFEAGEPIMTFVVPSSVRNPFRKMWIVITNYVKLKRLLR
jgi:hypothetical protein